MLNDLYCMLIANLQPTLQPPPHPPQRRRHPLGQFAGPPPLDDLAQQAAEGGEVIALCGLVSMPFK
jgi:hypothetical protein